MKNTVNLKRLLLNLIDYFHYAFAANNHETSYNFY